jgi:cytochrome P450
MPTARAIPTHPGRPFIDHLRAFRADSVGFLMGLTRTDPDLVRVKVGVYDRMFSSSPELIHTLLVERADDVTKSLGVQLFAAPLIGDGLLRLEGSVHRQRRRMLAPAFMPKRIASYADEMVERARVSAERILQQPQLDVGEEATRVTMEIVAKTLFDAEVSDDAENVGAALTDAMRCMMDAMMGVVPLPPQVPSPSNLRARRAIKRLDAVIYRMIRERRQAAVERGDLLSILLAARDQDDGSALDDRAVRDEAMTLFLAGHETTANTLTWALYLLGQHPSLRQRVEREVDALGGRRLGVADLPALPFTLQVIKETLRLMPPAYITGRILRQPLTFGDYQLPAGDTVMINIIGLHRRADLYPEPERFDPDRFAPEREKQLPRHAFIPFGAGPRVCIGNHFAWMESQLVLATWLQRVRFDPVSAEPPGFAGLITLRPRGTIAMRVSPRRSLASSEASSPS